ncbi:hypothetical protein CYMTET_11193 [Cymbomonas tetramitiformis]|uniref:Uncharacterized protein n=1 Tax=Cymbomonas tetramitiformis TaxID=36881 RepID=A0AAE0LD90_9CHLO|nr:hypothetical protein CYMTET_11193 [Cymbomonas tetramitiformis]
MGIESPAKGRAVTLALKGMAALRAEAAVVAGETKTERIWLPAKHVHTVHEATLTLLQEDNEELRWWLRACVCAYVALAFVSFGRPGTGAALQRERALAGDDVRGAGGAGVALDGKVLRGRYAAHAARLGTGMLPVARSILASCAMRPDQN